MSTRPGIRVGLMIACLCGSAYGGQVEDARAMLARAAGEIKGAKEADFAVLVELSQLESRFDHRESVRHLRRALEMAEASKDGKERAKRLEAVALSAGLLDKDLLVRALSGIEAPEELRKEPTIELKMLAIQLVLAHHQGQPTEEKLLKEAKDFCREHRMVPNGWQGPQDLPVGMIPAHSVVGPQAVASLALVQYVGMLDSELGLVLWRENAQGYEEWYLVNLFQDMVHYRSPTAIPLARELLKDFGDTGPGESVLVQMYKAGAREEALKAVEHMPRAAEALLLMMADEDPKGAVKFALGQKSQEMIDKYASRICDIIEREQPGEGVRLAQRIGNVELRSRELSYLVGDLIRWGKIVEARRATQRIEMDPYKTWAELEIAAATGDRKTVLKLVGEDLARGIDDAYWRLDWDALCKVLGVKGAERFIEEHVPEVKGNWKTPCLCNLVWEGFLSDPEWAGELFKRGPHEDFAKDWGKGEARDYVPELLRQLSFHDPDYVAQYMVKYMSKADPEMLRSTAKSCAETISGRSIAEAKAFLARVDGLVPDGIRVEQKNLEFRYWVSRIRTSGKRMNEELEASPFKSIDERREAMLDAFRSYTLPGTETVEGLLDLTRGLRDRDLADWVVVEVLRKGWFDHSGEGMKLIKGMHSPWRRAEALCARARRKLRYSREAPTLAGWEVRQVPEK